MASREEVNISDPGANKANKTNNDSDIKADVIERKENPGTEAAGARFLGENHRRFQREQIVNKEDDR